MATWFSHLSWWPTKVFKNLSSGMMTFWCLTKSIKTLKALTENIRSWNEFHSSFRPRRTFVQLQFWMFCHLHLGSICTTSVQSSFQTASAAALVAASAARSTLKHRGMTAWHSSNTQLLYTHPLVVMLFPIIIRTLIVTVKVVIHL